MTETKRQIKLIKNKYYYNFYEFKKIYKWFSKHDLFDIGLMFQKKYHPYDIIFINIRTNQIYNTVN